VRHRIKNAAEKQFVKAPEGSGSLAFLPKNTAFRHLLAAIVSAANLF
jgi:hypothetical protein